MIDARRARSAARNPAAHRPGRPAPTAGAKTAEPGRPVARRSSAPSAARATAAARLAGVSARTIGAAVAAFPIPDGRGPQPVETPGPRHLRVVDPTDDPQRRRRRARILLVTASAAVVMVAFGLVYLHVLAAQRQFRLDKLTTVAAEDQATYQRLRLQVAELEAPQNIIATAEGRLGMKQPASVTYLSPPAGSPSSGTTRGAGASGLSGPTGAGAVAGDADWPQIKGQLAGSP